MKNILPTILMFGIVAASYGQSSSNEASGGLSFVPDFTLSGSGGWSGWQSVGDVDWRGNESGSWSAVVKSNGSGGFILSNHSLQDAVVHMEFKCSEGAEAGVLFRMEKTADGWKGVLVSVKGGEVASYAIAFEKNGKELKREELKRPGGYPLVRMATVADTNSAARSGNRNRNGSRRSDANLPLVHPDTSYRSNDWNQIEIVLDLNITRSFLNDGGQSAVGIADDAAGRFGPVALFVAGAGEVRFKDFGCKDFSTKFLPEEKTSPRYRVQRINDMYYSWGMSAADFNKDGVMDVIAGPYIYFGPEFTTYREIFPAFAFNPSKEFTEVNCEYAFDFNGDGWPDVLTGPPNAYLYINPKNESRRWDKYLVVPSVQSEVSVFKDIDGSGVPALIYCSGGVVCYAKPDPADPTKPWVQHVISEKGLALAHGIGAGDINGDGRMDIVNPNGWWEQPAEKNSTNLWKFHPTAFARYGHRSSGAGGAAMAVYDVNGDGLNDVVTSLNAHGFGLAWFEQKRDSSGDITFARHMIADDYSTTNAGGVTFSELHGATSADLDGDGIPDFIVGKRYWSHLDSSFDPDPYGPPVLYCYRTVRNPKAPGGAEFVPELIHNRSGAGSDVFAVDLNGDGRVDVITSTDRGTFIFWNIGTPAK